MLDVLRDPRVKVQSQFSPTSLSKFLPSLRFAKMSHRFSWVTSGLGLEGKSRLFVKQIMMALPFEQSKNYWLYIGTSHSTTSIAINIS